MWSRLGLFLLAFLASQVFGNTTTSTINYSNSTDITEETNITRIEYPKGASEPTNFAVTAVTDSSVTLQWGEPENPNGPITGYQVSCFSATENFHVKVRETSNKFINLKYRTFYRFSVAAYNLILNDTKATTVIGEYAWAQIWTNVSKPSKPTDLVVTELTESSVALEWGKPEHPNGVISGYIVNCTSSTHSLIQYVFRTSSHLVNLHIGTFYNIAVAAYNNHSRYGTTIRLIGPTASVLVKTSNSTKPSPPEDLVVSNSSSTSLELSWSKPSTEIETALTYEVRYNDETNVFVEEVDDTSYCASGLKPFTYYSVTVTALYFSDEERIRGLSATVIARTNMSAPSEPQFESVGEITAHSFQVFWTKPLVSNGPLSGYFVTYDVQNRTWGFYTKETRFTFIQLEPWTNYTFYIAAYNLENGNVLRSNYTIVTGQTEVAAPGAPESVSIVKRMSSKLYIEWTEPLERNGPIDGYEVSCISDNDTNQYNTSSNEFIFARLDPSTRYNVSVRAYNEATKEAGIQQILTGPALSIEATTLPSAPKAPKSVLVGEVTNNSIEINWEYWTDPRPEISGFFLNLGAEETEYQVSANTTSFVFYELQEWTEYNVSVSAFIKISLNENETSMIFGHCSNITVRTAPSAPSKPTEVRVGQVTNSSIDILWRSPVDAQTPVSGFSLNLKKGKTSYQTDTNDTSYTFTGLEPWTDYTVSVAAFINIVGSRPQVIGEYVTVVAKSGATAPPLPLDLSLTSTDATSARFVIPLDLFSSKNGDIENYFLLVAAMKAAEGPSERIGYDKNSTFNSWAAAKDGNEWYQSSPNGWDISSNSSVCTGGNATVRTCVVGGEACLLKGHYCNGPLRPKTNYSVKVRGYTAGGWAETNLLEFTTTNASGKLVSMSSGGIILFIAFYIFYCKI